jgi:hypothetical protein
MVVSETSESLSEKPMSPVPGFALTLPAFGGEACLFLADGSGDYKQVVGTKDIIVTTRLLGFSANFTSSDFRWVSGGNCSAAWIDIIQEGSWVTDRWSLEGFRPKWKVFFPPGDGEAVLFVVGAYSRPVLTCAKSAGSNSNSRQIKKEAEPESKPPTRENWFKNLFKPKKLSADDIFKEVAFQLVGAAYKHSTVMEKIHRVLDEQKPDLWRRGVLMKMIEQLES